MLAHLNPFTGLRDVLGNHVTRLRAHLVMVGSRVTDAVNCSENRLRAELQGLEYRTKAHVEHGIEELRAVILREIRAEFDARLGSSPSPALPSRVSVHVTSVGALPPARHRDASLRDPRLPLGAYHP